MRCQALLEKSPKSSISRRLNNTKLKTEPAKRYFIQSLLLPFHELILSSSLVGAARILLFTRNHALWHVWIYFVPLYIAGIEPMSLVS